MKTRILTTRIWTTRTSASKLPFKLAFILFLALTPISVWPQAADWDAHMKAGEKALQSLNNAKAEKEFQAAVVQAQSFPAPDLRTAQTLGKLAEVYSRESKSAQAEDALQQQAVLTEAAVGPEDPRLAYALISQSLSYELRNQPDQAAPLWSRSLAILKKAAKPIDPSVLKDMDETASSLRVHESNITGQEHIRSAILELRESLGASDQDLKFALRDMASLYQRTDRSLQAEPLLTRIIKMDEKNSGPESFVVAIDLDQLSGLYASEGKYEAALPLLQRRLEITEKINAPDSPSVRRRKNLETGVNYAIMVPQLPLLILTQGMMPSTGIPVRRPDQAEVFRCYKDLARAYAGAGKYPEAEAMYKQIITAEEKKAASTQKSELANMNLDQDLIEFARIYRNDHRYDDALATIRQSETVGRQIADSKFEKQNATSGSPSIFPWLSQIELAEIYREKGDTTAAAPVFEQSLQAVSDLKMPPGNPKIAELLNNYATMLRDEEKYDQSEALYIRSLNAWEKTNRSRNPQAAQTLMNYAALLRKLNRPAEAEAEALEARSAAMYLR
ncbi:tetratricopeptide repeat protein [Terracidiphilus gabretensis]|uniref:tetratricopeptide repeat protein n=1 Tax=Terracidiphilus gabretensis TaxID=1577687 RepID=UPI00071B10D8|nr:tetratricopeptide repeat protein [Terracidiphilus gabretensis]